MFSVKANLHKFIFYEHYSKKEAQIFFATFIANKIRSTDSSISSGMIN